MESCEDKAAGTMAVVPAASPCRWHLAGLRACHGDLQLQPCQASGVQCAGSLLLLPPDVVRAAAAVVIDAAAAGPEKQQMTAGVEL